MTTAFEAGYSPDMPAEVGKPEPPPMSTRLVALAFTLNIVAMIDPTGVLKYLVDPFATGVVLGTLFVVGRWLYLRARHFLREHKFGVS